MKTSAPSKYLSMMENLSVKKTNGLIAPHKAIMLLTIMDLIVKGEIVSNIIRIDNYIVETFRLNWSFFVADKCIFSGFTCNPWTPFWHLRNEPFWHFMPISDSHKIDEIVHSGQTPSIGKIKAHIKYAYLDPELLSLLRTLEFRSKVFEILFDKYINQKE